MKTRIQKTFCLFPLMLPLLFVLLFFGYAPPRFSVALYTDNIDGEGLGSSFLCPYEEYANEYRVGFYFGSQLKYVEIPGFHYDVKTLRLEISDVSSAEFYGFDVKVFGFNIGYYDMRGQIAPGHYGTAEDGVDVRLSDDGQRLHVDFLNPDTTTSITLTNDYLPAGFWLVYWAVLCLLTLLAAFGMSFLWERFPGMRVHLVSTSGIAAAMIMGCLICGSLPYVNYLDFLLNFLIFFAVSLLLNSLTLPFIGTIAAMGFVLFWYIADYFVIAYRNKPVMPADLKAIGTAKEVIGGYTLTASRDMLLGIAVVLLFSAASVLVWLKSRKKSSGRKRSLLRRGGGVLTAAVLLFLCVNNVTFAHLNSFQWDNKILKSFHSEGIALTFLKAAASARVKAPEGYSRELVRSWLEEYSAQTAPKPEGVQPTNIIMVMNEAFSDLRTVGLDPSVDVMPFVDSLEENTLRGNLFVSVFGGGTCNTEFEALTGNTLAFLSAGAYPYTENVTKPLFSLASYLGDAAYLTHAFHANEAKNWNRDAVYPLLGFSSFHDIGDFPAFTEDLVLHGHPADTADYRYMEAVGEPLTGTPRFFFDVTMQNHSPYDRWDGMEEAESLSRFQDLYFDTRVYLTLVKVSDDAARQLVETYRDSDEPTMIIFFGDHEPGLPAGAQRELYSTNNNLDRFITRFFIWTNYETEAVGDVSVSANFLPLLILERGSFALPPYVQMLREVHEKYPVITSQGVIDAEGRVYGSFSDVPEDPLIQKYQYIQYANLFDEIDEAWFQINDAQPSVIQP